MAQPRSKVLVLVLVFFYLKGTSAKQRAASAAPTTMGFLLEEPSHVLWVAQDGRHQHCQQLSQCQDMPVQ